jgi:uncharacterized SAM-binding protein YcdF (DUF218 family)
MRTFLRITATILVTLLALFALAWFSLGFYLSPQSGLEKSDAIVAVSGGDTTARALEAVKLYQQGWAPKLIFSGAALDPSGPSNAAAMRRIATEHGVPAGAVLLDEISTNTFENADSVRGILELSGWRKIILVTSPYHQRRAYITFRSRLGSDYRILNHSAIDVRWRRSAWWANDYSYRVTLAELQKTLFVLWSKHAG